MRNIRSQALFFQSCFSWLSRRGALLLLLSSTIALQACFPLFLGGAITGTTLAIDRRTTGTQLVDESLEFKIRRAINTATRDQGNVSVLSYNRRVLLTGQVPSEINKKLASQAASAFLDATAISNQLVVAPNVSLSKISSDTLLTTKVKSTLIADKNIPFRAIKVTSQLGVVYFMGLLTQPEANLTAKTISSISGVKKVVNLAQIISQGELAAASR